MAPCNFAFKQHCVLKWWMTYLIVPFFLIKLPLNQIIIVNPILPLKIRNTNNMREILVPQYGDVASNVPTL